MKGALCVGLPDDELCGDRSGDRPALLGGGQRLDLQAASPGSTSQFHPLHSRLALLEQEAVAGVGTTSRIVAPAGFVEHGERAQIAAVVDLVQEAVIAAAEIGGPQQDEVGAEGDAPASSRGASFRSTIAALAGWSGSTAKCSCPLIRS